MNATVDAIQVDVYCAADCGWSLTIMLEEPSDEQCEAVDAMVDYYDGRCPACEATIDVYD